MTNEITITFPAIPETVIAELNETEKLLAANEVAMIHTLREKYAPLARLNGNVRISWYRIGNQNWQEEENGYLVEDGKRVKGLLAADNFDRSHGTEFTGNATGSRLYLTADGWIEIERTGYWSNWQGVSEYWTCDGSFANGREFDAEGENDAASGGGIRHLSDEQVAAEYDIQDVLKQLGSTLADLAKKVPERLTKKRALAESISRAVEAMK